MLNEHKPTRHQTKRKTTYVYTAKGRRCRTTFLCLIGVCYYTSPREYFPKNLVLTDSIWSFMAVWVAYGPFTATCRSGNGTLSLFSRHGEFVLKISRTSIVTASFSTKLGVSSPTYMNSILGKVYAFRLIGRGTTRSQRKLAHACVCKTAYVFNTHLEHRSKHIRSS